MQVETGEIDTLKRFIGEIDTDHVDIRQRLAAMEPCDDFFPA